MDIKFDEGLLMKLHTPITLLCVKTLLHAWTLHPELSKKALDVFH